MAITLRQAQSDAAPTVRFVRPRTAAPWTAWARERRRRVFESALSRVSVAFQPIVSSRPGRQGLGYYEALVRSDEPGLESARDFVDLAIDLGRTVDLGLAVHRRVAAVLARRPDVTVFVNVDVDEFLSGLSGSADPLAAYADRVVLEMTERTPVQDLPHLNERAAALRARGYRFAIDDLGGGYAGLTSLAAMRPDFVKIDQALIRDIDASPVKEQIVSTILALCGQLAVRCIVEGVETEGERKRLLSIGADLMQGFLFGRPGDID